VRVVDEAGDLIKRRMGAVDSWETPRAPFEARLPDAPLLSCLSYYASPQEGFMTCGRDP